MPKYINLITYCKDVKALHGWIAKNYPEKVNEDGVAMLHKNIIGAIYGENESIALLKVKPEEVEYVESAPLEVLAESEGKDVYDKLTKDGIIVIRKFIPETVEVEGETIENSYRFGVFA